MQASLNTEIVHQGQKVGIWTQSLEISQKIGNDENGNPIFNIPPLLDNGTSKLDLVYYKLGASTQADPATPHTNITAFPGTKDNGYIDPNTQQVYTSGVTENLNLWIGIEDNLLEWKFEEEPAAQILDNWPVVYAIYRERGYNLTVTKTVTEETGYTEPYSVTISSTAINRDKYTVTGTGYSTISAIPAQLDGSNQLVDGTGLITFEVRDGDSVTINGLIPGTYTVTETGNDNDVLSVSTVPVQDPAVTVTDNSTTSFSLNTNMQLVLTNAPKAICRIGSLRFFTLSSAVDYISAHSATMSGTIEMLTDYLMPASDAPVIPAYLNVSLTTANDYSGSGVTATITRKDSLTTPMFNNLGTLTLGNVILDGNNVSGSAMVSNEGTLTLGGSISVTNLTSSTTTDPDTGVETTTTTATAATVANSSPLLKNANGSGDGGAICSLKGAVNVKGGTIEDCSAENGGAIYAEAGTLAVSGGTILDNSATYGGAIYYAGSDTVTVSGGTIGASGHPNTATDGGAIYMSSGVINVSGGTIAYNEAGGSGGAIYALNAYVNVNGAGASIDHNTAAVNGGAVHMETLTFKLSQGSITNNSAANGGAIWAGTGSVELSGGSMSQNSATGTSSYDTTDPTNPVLLSRGGCGGAVYTQSSAFLMTGGTVQENAANENGGGVYTESGSVTVSNSASTIRDNTAGENGGGVYTESGSVTMSSSAQLYGNAATAGNGGALYVGSGTASLTGVTIGDTTSGNANQAVNGSGVFVDTGTLSVTDGSIGGNEASSGGAVGVGSAEARLHLYNNVRITGNTMNGAASNVYLNFDTDSIINFQTLAGEANVGIYVSDDAITVDGEPSTVLEQRGVPNTRFALYVADSVKNNMGKIHNDRTTNLAVRNETTNKKLYWVRDFTVKIYYVADYTSGLPFGTSGSPDYTNNFGTSDGNYVRKDSSFTPTSFESAISDVATDIRNKGYVSQNGSHDATAVFGSAFVQGSRVNYMSYGQYLTEVYWDTNTNQWMYVQSDGVTEIAGGTTTKTLLFIFTEPYYLSIENNAKDNSGNGLTLVISGLDVTVNGAAQSVINNSSAGYGYLYARNDEIRNELRPVQASDLVLAYGESVRILLPGGKNMNYALTGTYYSTYDAADPTNNVPATGTVDFRQRVTTSTVPTQLATGSVTANAVSVSGGQAKTPSDAGQTHELIFGGDRAICRLVVSARIADPNTSSGYVESGFVDEADGEGATAGKYEYTFNSPKQANDFIMAHHSVFTSGSTVSATIEMLMDYMIPASEQVQLTTGSGLVRDITFQTSVDGHFRYHPDETNAAGTGAKPRATISRASGNLSSFITTPNGGTMNGAGTDYVDKLTVKNLIFDGKSFGGNSIARGIIYTEDWNVEIDSCDFKNCQAQYGGGIFIESTTPLTNSSTEGQTPYGHLTVQNSTFENCQSLLKTNKYGGGGIWTSMKYVTITDCQFTACHCEAQGGAIFHFVNNYADFESYTTISGCNFEGCSATTSGGSVECGARDIHISNSNFRNSTANDKNGGALNIWSGNSEVNNGGQGNPTTDSWVTLTGCTFENCYALKENDSNKGNGGAMRSTANYNTITDCTFINNIGTNGGAINLYSSRGVDAVISGCTFTGCSGRERGGAIWCRSKNLTIQGTGTKETVIRSCTAPNEGGGVYHANNGTGSTLAVADTTIDTCSSTTKAGGGVYTTALTATFTDSVVENCSTVAADQNGGGLYLAGRWTTLSGTTIRNCTATGLGGGVYQENGKKDSFTVTNGSVISGNIAGGSREVTSNNVTYQMSGGGIYTNTKTFTLEDSSVTDNQAAGSGGGVCQNYNGTDGGMIVDGATVTGNICGGHGGGLFTLTNMTLKGVTSVTGNRLTTLSDTANNAAGIYLRNGVNLSLGVAGHTSSTVNGVTTYPDTFDITGNLTVDGTRSDLRLPDITSNGETVNDNRVLVYCGIGGEIRVVNANKKLTRFGTAQGSLVNPAGFTDEHKVFWAEDDSLYGIVDRQDSTGKKIIWGGDPICKITDGNGRLLYIKVDETHYRPAVFDRLDDGTGTGTTTTSAFSTLRSLDNGGKLYYVNGDEYTGNDFQVKMLVENYTAEYYITATGGTGRNVTLTTAKTTDSLHPYRGRENTRCTILRDPNMNTGKALVTAQTNLTLSNIVLDGGSENGVTASANTRVITADAGSGNAIQITLGRNATLQNAAVTTETLANNANGKGGGVYLNNGAGLNISGGSIRNCSAVEGGGVYIDGNAGTFIMSVGTITRCTASSNGGGVYFNKGKLTTDGSGNPVSGFMRITGGSITRCVATDGSGGGVYLNAGNASGSLTRVLYMSGGSIASNHAKEKGGGVFVGDEKVRLYFSGAPYVHGSSSDESLASDKACNVEMDQTFSRAALYPGTVIVCSGLNRGATIGVYVPETDNGKPSKNGDSLITQANINAEGDWTLFDKHGAELDPFATFTDGGDRGLNYFLNDRNGMKGGKLDNPNGNDQKIYWRIIYALSVKKQVLSDDPADMTTYRFKLTLSGTITNADNTTTTADSIRGIYGDMTFTPNVGDHTSVAYFSLTNGQTKTADLLPLGFDYTVEELLTTAQTGHFRTSVENWNGTVTNNTTTVNGAMSDQDHFNYQVTFSNLHAICKVTDEQGRLLYTYNSATGTYVPAVYSELVTAFNKVNQGDTGDLYYLDTSGKGQSGYPEDYYFVDHPTSYRIEMLVDECEEAYPSSLLNGRTVVLTTAERDAEDGFPYVGADPTAKILRGFDGESMITVRNGSLTLGNITLDGNGAGHPVSSDGGILSVASGSSLTAGTGATLQNSTTSGDGAAVYLAQGATMNLSGAPVFSNNVKTNAVSGSPKNGDDASFYSGTTSPQDLYIAGYDGVTAGSVIVTGDLSAAPGSITVWAAEHPHYVQNQQFAVMSGGTWTGLDAFRNARPDTITENPLHNQPGTPLYLYGVARDGKVFWSGSMDLTVSKTVTGDFADPTMSYDFTVTFTDLNNGYQCDFVIYSFDGTSWTPKSGSGNAGKKTVSGGSVTFSLMNNEKIVLSIPRGVTVSSIEESYPGYGLTSYVISGGSSTYGRSTGSIVMNADTTVAYTNHFPPVGPTGVDEHSVPFLWLTLAGMLLVIFVWLLRREWERRADETEQKAP